jgi:hypothetical protein
MGHLAWSNAIICGEAIPQAPVSCTSEKPPKIISRIYTYP